MLNIAVEKDLEKALFYFDRGTKQGSDNCGFFAAALTKELGLPEEKEIEYLRMAANKGHSIAQHHMGAQCVRYGKEWIHAPTWVEGVHWYRRAVKGGYKESAKNLDHIEKTTKGICFHCGVTAKAQGIDKFNRCAKCKAVYYCSA